MAREARPAPLPALTGLRFVAAMSVLLGHGLSAMSALPGADPFWRGWLAWSSAFGMSCFFVLSGFVIHYNYGDSIVEYRWRGAANFLSARFARLYPLYFVCVLWSLYDHGYFFNLASGQHPELEAEVWRLAPFYLTLTQSWIYSIVGSNAVIYGYPFSSVTQLSWSVSTELFFYVVYPAVCFAVVRLRRLWPIVAVMTVVCAVAFGSMHLAYDGADLIDRFGMEHFGPIAGLAHGSQDSFFRWLIYFAPYTRLPEFLLGCLVAALYRQTAAREPSALEQRIGAVVTGAAAIAVGVMMWMMALPSNPLPFLQFLHMNFGFALPAAVLIFCAARYRNAISAALSCRAMVRCGDASYSIYLLHLVVIESAGLQVLNIGQSGWLTSVIILRFLLATLATIGLSLVTYHLLEAPTRRWLRRRLMIELRGPAASVAGLSHPVEEP